ncbi:uncharacterized protein LOC135818629 isoform X1 [Sycon ciliatum]|uniref:uncharacterized protein LOC135817063 isoform X1 n=1 Tax=Sycon ciliatum TaxID=27933 RepID=UPI0031F69962
MLASLRPLFGSLPAPARLCSRTFQQCSRNFFIQCPKARPAKSFQPNGHGVFIRRMCSQTEKEQLTKAVSPYRKITYYILAFTMGVGTVAYVLSHLSIRLTKYFTKVTFVDSWKLGVFVGGFLSGTMCLALGLVARRLLTVSPERVFHRSMRYLVSSSAIRDHLGSDLHVGMFKAYSYQPRFARFSNWRSRDFAISAVSDVQTLANTEEASFRSRLTRQTAGSPNQPAGSLRLLFQLSGGDHDAMVSVDAYQHLFKRSVHIKSLAVTDTHGHCIVLLGKPEDVFYQGKISLR